MWPHVAPQPFGSQFQCERSAESRSGGSGGVGGKLGIGELRRGGNDQGRKLDEEEAAFDVVKTRRSSTLNRTRSQGDPALVRT